MGGLGSGRYPRADAKTTVEDCLSLGIGDLRPVLSPGTNGTLKWSGGAAAAFSVMDEAGTLYLILDYRLAGTEDICVRVPLEPTRPTLGGLRWWFGCPRCGRRAGKLFLPPGARRFACRQCHNLTYESVQDAHQTDRRHARWLAL